MALKLAILSRFDGAISYQIFFIGEGIEVDESKANLFFLHLIFDGDLHLERFSVKYSGTTLPKRSIVNVPSSLVVVSTNVSSTSGVADWMTRNALAIDYPKLIPLT